MREIDANTFKRLNLHPDNELNPAVREGKFSAKFKAEDYCHFCLLCVGAPFRKRRSTDTKQQRKDLKKDIRNAVEV